MMGYNEEKNVYYNEIDQKAWRTNTTAGDLPISFDLIGSMTETEYNLLIESLYKKYNGDSITKDQFKDVFELIRKFCDKI
tara:strand:- start:350 stop:589 length:240 start_codon:yes stop_codon:yes gene_type:complete